MDEVKLSCSDPFEVILLNLEASQTKTVRRFVNDYLLLKIPSYQFNADSDFSQLSDSGALESTALPDCAPGPNGLSCTQKEYE